MFYFDYITKEHIKEHDSNWPEILEHPYRKLILRGTGFGKNK